jgi:hypothetical protein
MAFACVYVLAQQADPNNPKMMENKEPKLDFEYFGIISFNHLWTAKSPNCAIIEMNIIASEFIE